MIPLSTPVTSAGPKARPHSPPAKHNFDFDLFTIGGGSAGVRAARYSAGMGVALPANRANGLAAVHGTAGTDKGEV